MDTPLKEMGTKIKYDSKKAMKMPINQLAEQLFLWAKSQRVKGSNELTDYYGHLKGEIDHLLTLKESMQEENIMLNNENNNLMEKAKVESEKVAELTENNKKLEQEQKRQKEELLNLKVEISESAKENKRLGEKIMELQNEDTKQNELQEKEQEIEELTIKISQLTQEKEDILQTLSALTNELEVLKQQYDDDTNLLENKIAELKTIVEVKDKDERVQKLLKELERQELQQEVLRARLDERVSIMAEMKQQFVEMLKETLNQQFRTTEKEIRSKIEVTGPSYAEVLDFPALPRQNTITLKRKDDNIMVHEIRKELNSNVSSADFNVNECFHNKNGDLIIKCSNSNSTKKLKDYLNTNEKLQKIVEIKENKQKRKRLIMFGVPEELENIDIHDHLTNLIPTTEDLELKFIKDFKSRNGQKSVVIEVFSHVAEWLLKKEKFVIAFSNCTIRNYINITRCYKCCRFGHIANKCTGKQTCGFCSRHHKTDECPHKNIRKEHCCINCKDSGRDLVNHPAFVSSCPSYREVFSKAKSEQEGDVQLQKEGSSNKHS